MAQIDRFWRDSGELKGRTGREPSHSPASADQALWSGILNKLAPVGACPSSDGGSATPLQRRNPLDQELDLGTKPMTAARSSRAVTQATRAGSASWIVVGSAA